MRASTAKHLPIWGQVETGDIVKLLLKVVVWPVVVGEVVMEDVVKVSLVVEILATGTVQLEEKVSG